MADLAERTALHGLDLPHCRGEAVLSALPPAAMISIAPFRDRGQGVSEALGAQGAGALTGAGAARGLDGGGRLIWTGDGQWMLRGSLAEVAALHAALDGLAAVTDQTCAWTGLHLGGTATPEVLARLVPVDCNPAAFPPGRVARTLLGHMMCVLCAVEDGVEILVMRSFTRTAVHEIEMAMARVAGATAVPGRAAP